MVIGKTGAQNSLLLNFSQEENVLVKRRMRGFIGVSAFFSFPGRATAPIRPSNSE